jgi:hypothetical protein
VSHARAPEHTAKQQHGRPAVAATTQHGNRRAVARPQTEQPAAPQSHGNPQQQAPAQPSPADQVTGAAGAVEQQATDTAQGLANGLGHAKK